jgi:superfamily I DNA and/or RNA helicase
VVEVRTVDGFQGREKAVIVFSAVRSNPRGTVGFLADYRRLNVGLTRARRGLIVVGDDATLRKGDAVWRSWLSFVESNGLVVPRSAVHA